MEEKITRCEINLFAILKGKTVKTARSKLKTKNCSAELEKQ
jgi:hypothetical protein